jgi:hypothetical protein
MVVILVVVYILTTGNLPKGDLKEGAATSPATLVQLATSSPYYHAPYYYSHGYHPYRYNYRGRFRAGRFYSPGYRSSYPFRRFANYYFSPVWRWIGTYW